MKKDNNVEKQTNKKKKNVLSVICYVLVLLLIVIVVVAVKNWGNIRAVFMWLTSSKEEIEQGIQKGKEQQVTALKDAGMQGASKEMMDALSAGKITSQQFQMILLGNLTLEQAIQENDSQGLVVNSEKKFIKAVDAYEEGKITDIQLLQISKEEITLEQAIEENAEQQNGDTEITEQKPDDNSGQSSETEENTSADTSGAAGDTETTQKPANDDSDKTETTQKPSADDSGKNESTQKAESGKEETGNKENKPEPEKSNSTGFTQETIDAYKNGEISDSQFAEIGSNNITLEEAKQENKNNVNQSSVQSKPSDSGNSSDVQTPSANPNQEQTVPEQPPKEQQNQQQNQQQSQPSASTGSSADEQIAALVTKMYVLKAEYEGAVAGIVESMKAQFSALPASERTTSSKSSIAASYMGQINSMEAQCDAQVNAIVSELRQVLSSNGRDTALADSILSTYASEKEATKAYYMSQYGD